MTNDFGLLFFSSMKPRRTRLTTSERSFLTAESDKSERPSFGGGLLDCELNGSAASPPAILEFASKSVLG